MQEKLDTASNNPAVKWVASTTAYAAIRTLGSTPAFVAATNVQTQLDKSVIQVLGNLYHQDGLMRFYSGWQQQLARFWMVKATTVPTLTFTYNKSEEFMGSSSVAQLVLIPATVGTVLGIQEGKILFPYLNLAFLGHSVNGMKQESFGAKMRHAYSCNGVYPWLQGVGWAGFLAAQSAATMYYGKHQSEFSPLQAASAIAGGAILNATILPALEHANTKAFTEPKYYGKSGLSVMYDIFVKKKQFGTANGRSLPFILWNSLVSQVIYTLAMAYGTKKPEETYPKIS